MSGQTLFVNGSMKASNMELLNFAGNVTVRHSLLELSTYVDHTHRSASVLNLDSSQDVLRTVMLTLRHAETVYKSQ